MHRQACLHFYQGKEETKRLRRGVSPSSEIKGIFPMKWCAVTWNTLCLLCLLMPLALLKQVVDTTHASAFTELSLVPPRIAEISQTLNPLKVGSFCRSVRSLLPR